MKINVANLKMQSRKQKKRNFDWVSALLILLAIGIIIGSIYFIFYFRESKVEEELASGSPLSGIIVENSGEKSEAVFLTFYNPKTAKQAFIVLPQKTRLKVDYEDRPVYDVVENIYPRGGISVLRKTMEKLTGADFPYYAVVHLNDIERLVDLLEGVKVIVPDSISYRDAEHGIFIQIPGGTNTLDGAKMKELLAYKYGEDGFKAQVENHRIFVDAMLDRADDIETLLQHSRTAGIFIRDVETNLSKKDLTLLIHEMQKMNSSHISFYKMYGKDVTIKGEQFITPVENGKWLRERIETVKKFLNDEGPVPIGDEIKMEILNGSENPGQAQSLRNYFVEYGFNVVHYGNALRSDYERTIVIDRIGRPSLAKRIADIINCREVYTRIDKTLLVDVTIIIGNDFEGKYVR